jgi:hypothetical protein
LIKWFQARFTQTREKEEVTSSLKNPLADSVHAPPPAAATLEALRGLGYSAWAAIADLIDNSISADAANVWIEFHWAGKHSFISILDDGSGMTSEKLISAMTLGSIDPRTPREANDLGRFGLGLKTASLSQARCLTVSSATSGGQPAVYRWDLDHVAQTNQWYLLSCPKAGSESRLEPIHGGVSGTLVLLEELDRLVPPVDASDRQAHRDFLNLIDRIGIHLSMIFHRFLEGTSPKLRIYINGRTDAHRIRPWDPFLSHHPATIATPVERIQTASGTVQVQGFVLPHSSRLSEAEFSAAAGAEGWASQQGFYVYRNQRLLVPGSWLGLGGTRAWTKEEPFKLARIRLDIPNSADAEWKINVTKAMADPPAFLRSRLRDLATSVRQKATKVFAYRGSAGNTMGTARVQSVWLHVEDRDGTKVKYRLNRNHPAIQQLLATSPGSSQQLDAIFRIIEETVPVERIWLDVTASTETGTIEEEQVDLSTVENVLRIIFSQFVNGEGLSPEEAKRRILLTEPFHRYPDLVENLTLAGDA